MGEGGRIWVTRAQPGADATAARLRTLGCAPLVASLLVVRPLNRADGPPDGFAALAFTSANAVRAFAGRTLQRSLPVFAVGSSTAEAARLAGFTQVSSADGDVAALASRIAAERPPGLVLHPCAVEASGDLEGAVAPMGVDVRSFALYETRSVEHLPSAVTNALQEGGITAVLLHSPKAARVLAALWTASAKPDLTRVRAVGLSEACLAPVARLPFASTVAAAQPNEAALLERLV